MIRVTKQQAEDLTRQYFEQISPEILMDITKMLLEREFMRSYVHYNDGLAALGEFVKASTYEKICKEMKNENKINSV